MLNSDLNLNLPKNKVASKLKYSDIDEAYKHLAYSDDNQNFIGLEFILLDGPPYANGDLHIGHIINRTIKDSLVRYQMSNKKRICYVLGWDCHGLPIEAKAIEQLGIKEIKRDNNSRKIINSKSLEIMTTYSDKQAESLKKYHMVIYDQKYYTHSPDFIESTLNTMWNMVKDNYIQYLKKPNYYSLNEKTNLAFAEIVYKDKKDISLIFIVNLENSKYSLLVWTTQPWTILANEFIGINKKIQYCIVKTQDNKQLICSVKYATENKLEIIDSVDNTWLIEQEYKMLHDVKKIVDATEIITEDGTGILHLAPAHGFEDFQIALNNGFDIKNIQNCVDLNGYALDPRFEHKSLLDNSLNKAVIEYIQNLGLVYKVSEIYHRYPFSSRSHTPLYILSTYQAMIVISDRDKLDILQKFNQTNWCAAEGFETYKTVINNRPTFWCITRQRSWGTPCMLLVDEESNIIYDKRLNEVLLNCMHKYGFDFWYDDEFMYGILKDLNLEEYAKNRIKCVLDVWFESGVAGINLYNTRAQNHIVSNIDYIVEGRDQHRGWFSSLGIINQISNSNIKIKNVVVHGFACYAKSNKISKSNEDSVRYANDLLSNVYPEIIRLSVFSSDFIHDIIINDDNIKQAEKLYLSIYGMLRFFVNMMDYRIISDIKIKNIDDLDQLIYRQFLLAHEKFVDQVEKNKINSLSNCLEEMMYYANEYIRVSKDILYCHHRQDSKLQNILAIMEDMLVILCKDIYIICPGLVMYIYGNLYKLNSEYDFINKLSKHKLLGEPNSKMAKMWEDMYHIYKIINIKLDFHKKNKLISANYEIDIILVDEKGIMPDANDSIQDIIRLMDVSNFIYTTNKDDISIKTHIIDTFNYQGLVLYVRKVSSMLYKCIRCWKYNSFGPEKMCQRCNITLNTKS